MKIAFVFGEVWQLSLAEILAYLKRINASWEFVDLTKKALVISAEIDVAEAMSSLGGTMKIAEIAKEFEFKKIQEINFEGGENEPLSFYGSHELFRSVKKKFPKITPAGVLSPKDLITKKHAGENVLIFGLKKCYYGRTISVQPFISKLDEMHPFKDEEIPASRTMILANLSQARESVFVPNTGTGAIGCGAALIGVPRIVMQEKDKNKLEKARKNLSKFAGVKVKAEREIKEKGFLSAACVLPSGPMIRERIPKKDAEDILRYARKEQKTVFDDVVSHCAGGATFACVFPVFNTFSGKVFAGKHFDNVRMLDPFDGIPREYRDYLKLGRKMIVDEEPGRRYSRLREFCVYEVAK
ncbi:MAG: hypothetical protein QXO69_02980 [archaeon]